MLSQRTQYYGSARPLNIRETSTNFKVRKRLYQDAHFAT